MARCPGWDRPAWIGTAASHRKSPIQEHGSSAAWVLAIVKQLLEHLPRPPGRSFVPGPVAPTSGSNTHTGANLHDREGFITPDRKSVV